MSAALLYLLWRVIIAFSGYDGSVIFNEDGTGVYYAFWSLTSCPLFKKVWKNFYRNPILLETRMIPIRHVCGGYSAH